jgi:hypothetical protein
MTRASVLSVTRLMLLFVTAVIVLLDANCGEASDSARWRFEPVESEFTMGKPIRLDVRVTGAAFQAPTAILTVKSARLDMSPDGKPEMIAPVRPVGVTGASILAFETEFTMTGRWALTITAEVAGEPNSITGVAIFTATEKRANKMSVPETHVRDLVGRMC